MWRTSCDLCTHMNDMDYAALAAFHDQLHRTMASTISHTREAGLQPEAFLLMVALRRQPEGSATTVVQLSALLHANRSDVVELVEGLVRRGFVARTRDRSDRRRFLISLTPAGEG